MKCLKSSFFFQDHFLICSLENSCSPSPWLPCIFPTSCDKVSRSVAGGTAVVLGKTESFALQVSLPRLASVQPLDFISVSWF